MTLAPRCPRCGRRHLAGLPCWKGDLPVRLLGEVLAEYGDVCHLCGREGADCADHVIPRAHGGTDTLTNLRPAHNRPCNARRGAMHLEAWFALYPLTPPTYTPSRDW